MALDSNNVHKTDSNNVHITFLGWLYDFFVMSNIYLNLFRSIYREWFCVLCLFFICILLQRNHIIFTVFTNTYRLFFCFLNISYFIFSHLIHGACVSLIFHIWFLIHDSTLLCTFYMQWVFSFHCLLFLCFICLHVLIVNVAFSHHYMNCVNNHCAFKGNTMGEMHMITQWYAGMHSFHMKWIAWHDWSSWKLRVLLMGWTVASLIFEITTRCSVH